MGKGGGGAWCVGWGDAGGFKRGHPAHRERWEMQGEEVDWVKVTRTWYALDLVHTYLQSP